jgi:hypothetical protein
MSSAHHKPGRDAAAPNPLVQTISCGNVQLSIFENEGQRQGVATLYYSVKVSRSYRDAAGNWNYTNTFYKSQLPQLLYACQKALEYLEVAESQPPF